MSMLHETLAIARADGEGISGLIWLIITVVVMVSQIRKAGKKTPPAARDSESASPSTEPSEELQQFLQSLSGSSQPPGRPKPPPVPEGTRMRPATGLPSKPSALRVRKQQKPKASLAPPLPSMPSRSPRHSPVPTPSPHADAWAKAEVPEFRHHRHRNQYVKNNDDGTSSLRKLREGVGDNLVGKEGLRKAMVLKEILGAPLALR